MSTNNKKRNPKTSETISQQKNHKIGWEVNGHYEVAVTNEHVVLWTSTIKPGMIRTQIWIRKTMFFYSIRVDD